MKPILRPIVLGLLALAAATLSAETAKGRLSLVSMGVGDPDNITVRAQKTIAAADIVFTMRPERLRERRPEMFAGKELYEAGHVIYGERRERPAGKDSTKAAAGTQAKNEPAAHTHDHSHGDRAANAAALAETNRKIIREAIAAGKNVVIVDNGDPLVFGPYACYLQEFADLNPEVVPGISSFNAANAALKRSVVGGNGRTITLGASMWTQRETDTPAADARDGQVFFTMRTEFPGTIAALKRRYPGDTPVAIVSFAGYSERESVMVATLDTIEAKLGDAKLPFEHLIYVGDFLR